MIAGPSLQTDFNPPTVARQARSDGRTRWATVAVLVLLSAELTEQVIGLAIEVHRNTGPGLLESVYEQCLCHELRNAGVAFERQVAIPVIYKAVPIGGGFKADIVVARQVILEIKSIAAILPAHESKLHTYLRVSGIHIGLILNFNTRRLTDGIRRYVV